MLTLGAVKDGMTNARNGVKFGEKMAQANKNFAERLTNNQKTLQRLRNEIEQYGLSEARIRFGQELVEKELKGRTLASVVSAHADRMIRDLDKAVDKTEEANIKAYYENQTKLIYDNLTFLVEVFGKAKVEAEVEQIAE